LCFPPGGVCIIAFFNEIIGWFTGTAPILNCDKVNEMKQLNWLCDNSKIKNELGFSAKYNLNNGIIETINWYKEKMAGSSFTNSIKTTDVITVLYMVITAMYMLVFWWII